MNVFYRTMAPRTWKGAANLSNAERDDALDELQPRHKKKPNSNSRSCSPSSSCSSSDSSSSCSSSDSSSDSDSDSDCDGSRTKSRTWIKGKATKTTKMVKMIRGVDDGDDGSDLVVDSENDEVHAKRPSAKKRTLAPSQRCKVGSHAHGGKGGAKGKKCGVRK